MYGRSRPSVCADRREDAAVGRDVVEAGRRSETARIAAGRYSRTRTTTRSGQLAPDARRADPGPGAQPRLAQPRYRRPRCSSPAPIAERRRAARPPGAGRGDGSRPRGSRSTDGRGRPAARRRAAKGTRRQYQRRRHRPPRARAAGVHLRRWRFRRRTEPTYQLPTSRTSGSSHTPLRSHTARWAGSHQCLHVGGQRPAVVHDEVRVPLREARAAHPRALQPGGLDQPTRVIAARVLEDRTGVRLPMRLAGEPPALAHVVHARTDRRRVVRRAGRRSTRRHDEARAADARAGSRRRAARGRARPARPCRVESLDRRRPRRRISPPYAPAFMNSAPPTVPGMPSAYSSPASAARHGRRAPACRAAPRHRRARTRRRRHRHSTRAKPAAELHDDAAHAAVADQHVRAAAEQREPHAGSRGGSRSTAASSAVVSGTHQQVGRARRSGTTCGARAARPRARASPSRSSETRVADRRPASSSGSAGWPTPSAAAPGARRRCGGCRRRRAAARGRRGAPASSERVGQALPRCGT